MNAHLPATQRFPGGYTVSIREVSAATLRRLANGADCFGLWYEAKRTIYVDRAISERKKRYTLAHEMDHAVNDWRHTYCGEDEA